MRKLTRIVGNIIIRRSRNSSLPTNCSPELGRLQLIHFKLKKKSTLRMGYSVSTIWNSVFCVGNIIWLFFVWFNIDIKFKYYDPYFVLQVMIIQMGL